MTASARSTTGRRSGRTWSRFGGILQRPPKPTRNDIVAGITSGIASIPDGMTSGVIAGVNPVYGLYTVMINTPISALTASTQLMVVNTTSAMILVAADGMGDLQGAERVHAMFGIALVAGLFQFVLGLLGLGTLTKFVSNAVMTGLLTGVAVLIILGQLWDFFGYSGSGSNKVEKTADLIEHFGQVDRATTLIGVVALALMFGLGLTRLSRFNLLIALICVTVVAWIVDKPSVTLVESLGDIPRSLPQFRLPNLGSAISMIGAGVAVGVVGLLQAAGVAQRYPNPDGKEPDDSQDFMAQGMGNIAGSFFSAMPGGGSISGTALGASAGAETRWAAFFMAPVVIVSVLAFASFLQMIPMAGLAAMLIYSSSLSIKFPLIQGFQNTNLRSFAAMILTFLMTLFVPLQTAILIGVIFAGVLFIYKSSTDIRLVRIEVEQGQYVEAPAPTHLASDQTVVLDVYGSLFYAGARTLAGQLPKIGSAKRAIVILRLRSLGDVGSTLVGVLNKYSTDLARNGGLLMVTGVDPDIKRRMLAANQLNVIGPSHIFESTNIRHQSTDAAVAEAEKWRALMTQEHQQSS